jgi:hypothetical protein
LIRSRTELALIGVEDIVEVVVVKVRMFEECGVLRVAEMGSCFETVRKAGVLA